MSDPLRIDIVSDVVCPWCAVGYNQLRVALEELDEAAEIHWHPFQLNPDMGPEGQNLREHLAEKYGVTPEQSAENRERLTRFADEVGFEMNFSEDMRTYNTLAAHQLIHWAREHGRETEMKLALLKAYFTDKRDISNPDTLCEIAASVGLDGTEARAVLSDGRYADIVREHMTFWTQQGISGVPAVILNQKYLVSGAAGVEQFKRAVSGAIDDKGSSAGA